jgi:hypothetical protein
MTFHIYADFNSVVVPNRGGLRMRKWWHRVGSFAGRRRRGTELESECPVRRFHENDAAEFDVSAELRWLAEQREIAPWPEIL